MTRERRTHTAQTFKRNANEKWREKNARKNLNKIKKILFYCFYVICVVCFAILRAIFFFRPSNSSFDFMFVCAYFHPSAHSTSPFIKPVSACSRFSVLHFIFLVLTICRCFSSLLWSLRSPFFFVPRVTVSVR